MTLTEQQIDMCRGEGFIPMPRMRKQEYDGPGAILAFFDCPFCGDNPPVPHYATILFVGDLDARPIHCHETKRMAWVNLADVIKDEEAKFFKLIEKFQDLPDWLEPKEAFRLKDQEGCPEELLEDRTDMVAFRLIAESKKHRKKVSVYG